MKALGFQLLQLLESTSLSTFCFQLSTCTPYIKVVALGKVSDADGSNLQKTYVITVRRFTVTDMLPYYTFTRRTAAAASAVSPYLEPSEEFAVALDAERWVSESLTGVPPEKVVNLTFTVIVDRKVGMCNRL